MSYPRTPPRIAALHLNRSFPTVVERHGWCWAMTSFGVDAYKASKKDLLNEGVALHSVSEEEV